MRQTQVTYLVLAHQLPDQLARLVRILTAGDSSVVVHVDEAVEVAPFDAALRRVTNDRWALARRRTDVKWGNFSMVDATIDLLHQAVEDHPAHHYILLSGSDFPIKTESELLARLSPGTSYINSWSMPDEARGKPMSRLQNYYLAFKRRDTRLSGLVNGYLLACLPRRNVQKGLGGLRPFGGSAWWALCDDDARELLAFADVNPRFVRFFRRSANPDEMFFQTIVEHLHVEAQDRRIEPALFFADWSAGGPSPAVLDSNRLGELFARPEFFARKFDSRVDSSVLDALDERLAGR